MTQSLPVGAPERKRLFSVTRNEKTWLEVVQYLAALAQPRQAAERSGAEGAAAPVRCPDGNHGESF